MKLGTGSGGGQISVNMGLPPFSSQACSFSTDALGPELFPKPNAIVWFGQAPRCPTPGLDADFRFGQPHEPARMCARDLASGLAVREPENSALGRSPTS